MTMKSREQDLMKDSLAWLPPRWLFNAATRLPIKPPAPMQVLFDAGGFMLPQWMFAAIELNLPDIIAEQPGQTTAILAAQLNVSEHTLERLLCALASRGYFETYRTEDGAKGWCNSQLSAILRRGHPNSVRSLVQHWVDDCYPAYSFFLEGLQTNEIPFRLAHAGKFNGFFEDYLPSSSKLETRFSEAMTATNAFFEAAVLEDYPWSRFKRVIDIGGSKGSFLGALLTRFRHLHGHLFDREEVIREAEEIWEMEGRFDGRASLSAGSFFDASTIPEPMPNDAYVLRNILHDWNDDDSVAILKALKTAIGNTSATIVIVEISRGLRPLRSVLEQARSSIDLLMYSMFGGQERSPPEMKALFNRAGLRFVGQVETRSIAVVYTAEVVD